MNILIIAPHFPTFDIYTNRESDPRSKFLHDYATEWVKVGHNVTVFHTIPKYPVLFYWFMRIFGSFMGIYGSEMKRFIQNRKTVKFADYETNGIKIIRIPVSKYIPHRDFFNVTTRKLVKKAKLQLSLDNTPELIFSDYLSPSLAVASSISKGTEASFYQIFHQSDYVYLKNINPHMEDKLNKANGLIFRSRHMEKMFTKIINNSCKHYYMYSGIPSDQPIGSARNEVKKLLYVGTLRKTKNIHIIISALAKLPDPKRFTLDIVGSGSYLEPLKELSNNLNLESQISFYGKATRKEVFEIMSESDCLVMVSKETFGMVYIEAMSQGCIVVAAKNEGIDGIVINGQNGFLVEIDNIEELRNTLANISLLPSKKVSQISENSIKTAASLREDVLASNLLDQLNS